MKNKKDESFKKKKKCSTKINKKNTKCEQLEPKIIFDL